MDAFKVGDPVRVRAVEFLPGYLDKYAGEAGVVESIEVGYGAMKHYFIRFEDGRWVRQFFFDDEIELADPQSKKA